MPPVLMLTGRPSDRSRPTATHRIGRASAKLWPFAWLRDSLRRIATAGSRGAGGTDVETDDCFVRAADRARGCCDDDAMGNLGRRAGTPRLRWRRQGRLRRVATERR